jgi:flagellar biosynthesis protein FlhA
MDPVRAHALVDLCAEQVDQALARGGRPVMLCSARVRRHLRRLWEQRLPQLAVCSYNEIAPGVSVETVGVLDANSIAARQGAGAVALAG